MVMSTRREDIGEWRFTMLQWASMKQVDMRDRCTPGEWTVVHDSGETVKCAVAAAAPGHWTC